MNTCVNTNNALSLNQINAQLQYAQNLAQQPMFNQFIDETKQSKNELGIHDFLAQIEMMRQVENMSDQEMLQQIPHLVLGNARMWYTMQRHCIFNWQDFVNQIKKRFLSTDYNCLLYSELQNRNQGKFEPIGNYIAEMQGKFRAMSNPLREHHQLYPVRNNILYEHAMALATHPIHSIEQLKMLVKQRESARASQFNYRKQINNMVKPSVNELATEEVTTPSEPETGTENDICNINVGEKRNPKQKTNVESRKAKMTCKKPGHMFRDCVAQRTRNFSYHCGKDDNVSNQCSNCVPPKNATAALLNDGQSETDNDLMVSQPDLEEMFPLTLIIESPEKDNRPHARVCIFGDYFLGLLDSGANVSVLGTGATKFLDKWYMDMDITAHNPVLRTADGNKLEILSSVLLPVVQNTSASLLPQVSPKQ